MDRVELIGKIIGDSMSVVLPVGTDSKELKRIKKTFPEVKFYLTWCIDMEKEEFEKYIKPLIEKLGLEWHRNEWTGKYEVYLEEVKL